jgi:hypothetical protein
VNRLTVGCCKCADYVTARNDDDLIGKGWLWTDDGWLCPVCTAERKLS